jgi:hypothetical protein
MMVFDTLFALDDAGNAQYQMLAGHTVDADQKRWTLTLRDGLLFHDNTPRPRPRRRRQPPSLGRQGSVRPGADGRDG